MTKCKALIIFSIIAVLAVPFSVFAATSNSTPAKTIRGFLGLDTSKFTDQQKSDVKNYTQKMADLQKEFINKMVSNGAMTKEQGNAEIKKIDGMLESGNTDGLLPGFGRGKGGFGGRGERGSVGFGKIDTSKLTDQQKTGLTDIYKKMATLQKDLVNKMVSDSLMTKAQGDAAAKKIDEISKGILENGLSKGMGMMMGSFSFNCFGIKGVDTSKLTAQQKSDLTDFSKKMADLQKELVNKLVSFNVITKEQSDIMSQKIDNAEKFQEQNGFFNGMKGGKGQFEGKRGMHNDFGKKGGFGKKGNSGKQVVPSSVPSLAPSAS